NGSAIGYYGASFCSEFDEDSAPETTDFLAQTVRLWEEAAERIGGVRLVKLRIGVVLANEGGALPRMVLPYRLGIGGPIGSGRQWLSWIDIDDLVRLIVFCIECREIEGA